MEPNLSPEEFHLPCPCSALLQFLCRRASVTEIVDRTVGNHDHMIIRQIHDEALVVQAPVSIEDKMQVSCMV